MCVSAVASSWWCQLAREVLELALQHSQHDASMLAGAHNNMGLLIGDDNRSEYAAQDAAIAHFRRAVELEPDAMYVYNWALALEAQGRWEPALRKYEDVLRLDPGHGGALLGIGNMLFRFHMLSEALGFYRRAAAAPSISAYDKFQARANTAAILATTDGGHEAAVNFTDRMIASGPMPVRITFLNVQGRREIAAWDTLEALEDDVLAALAAGCHDQAAELSVTPYDVLLFPVCERLSACVAADYGREMDVTSKLYPPPPGSLAATQPPWRPADGRLHVGYVSFDLREHPIGWMMHGVLLAHNRRAVVVTGYHYGTVRADLEAALQTVGMRPFDDLVDQLAAAYDPVAGAAQAYAPVPGIAARPRGWGTLFDGFRNVSHTVRLARAADHFFSVKDANDLEIGRHIVAGGVDVFVDLMAHTTGTRIRIPSIRPAPIIVNYLGYPGTTGMYSHDFAVVDRFVAPPEGEGATGGAAVPSIAHRAGVGRQWTEGLVYLPVTYQANTFLPHHGVCPQGGGVCHGTPLGSPRLVLANFNSGHKLEPRMFGVWMGILRRFPSAVLWLLSRRAAVAEGSLAAIAAAHGVHPSRVVFLPKVDRAVHYKRYSQVDLFLDTHLYTAHSTATDALWSGVPIVTVESGTFQGRVASSVMRAVGMGCLVTHSLKEYEDVVAQLLRRPALLYVLRDFLRLAHFRAALFDTGRTTRNLELAYAAMWDVRMAQLRVDAPNSASPVPPSVQPPPQCAAQFHAAPRLLRRCLVGWWPYNVVVHPADRHAVLPQVPPALRRSGGDSRHTWLDVHLRHRAADALQAAFRAFRDGDNQAAHAVAWRVYNAWDGKHPGAEFLYGMTLTQPLQQLLGAAPDRSPVGLCVGGLQLVRAARATLLDAIGLGPSSTWDGAGSGVDPSAPAPLPVFWEDAAMLKVLVRSAVLTCADHAAVALPSPSLNVTWFKISDELNKEQLPDEQLAAQWAAARVGHAVRVAEVAAVPPGWVPRPAGVPVLALYCEEYGQTWWPQWGPWDLHRGLGGSEEAVVYLTQALQRRGGFHIEVYGDPHPGNVGLHDGVAYYPAAWYNPDARPADVFMALRYPISVAVARNSKVNYVWLHDVRGCVPVPLCSLCSPFLLEACLCFLYVCVRVFVCVFLYVCVRRRWTPPSWCARGRCPPSHVCCLCQTSTRRWPRRGCATPEKPP